MDKVRKKALSFLFVLSTGMIDVVQVGVTLLNVFISYRIDKYHEEIQYLKSTIDDKDVKLKKLEEAIDKWKMVLKDIKIYLEFEGSEIDEIELIKHIRGKYNNLLGKEVKNIDIDMVHEIIDNRIMKLGRNEYKLKVKKIILTDTLEIWVDTELTE